LPPPGPRPPSEGLGDHRTPRRSRRAGSLGEHDAAFRGARGETVERVGGLFEGEHPLVDHGPVLLIGLFVLDLLVVHPFVDGNGRVARALTNALLADVGYGVGRWVSLEQLIAEDADEYYASLLTSTQGWHDGSADVWPWLAYFVRIVARAYERFTQRAASWRTSGSKQDRVREYVLYHAAPIFRIADIRAALPGISDQTIRLALDTLKREGAVTAEGTGRSATWRRTIRDCRDPASLIPGHPPARRSPLRRLDRLSEDTWQNIEFALPFLREVIALGLPLTAVSKWYHRRAVNVLRTLVPELESFNALSWEPSYFGAPITRQNWPETPERRQKILREWHEVARRVADGSFRQATVVDGAWR
jgi:hypothetical protein